MSTPAQFQIAMLVKADVANAKSGVVDFTGAVQSMGGAAAKAGAAAKQQAVDLQGLAAAAIQASGAQDQLVAAEKRSADARARALAAPLVNPAATVAPLQAAFKATETSALSLQQTVAGLKATIGSQAQEMVESAAAARAYQNSLDEVRASFNPLFAASRQYEQQLERISQAEKLGAITVREAAAARVAAAGQIAPLTQPGTKAGGASPYTANIGAQGFDIGVTAAMGMNPGMIGLMQGSQLAGIAQQMGGGTKAAKELAAGIMSIFNPTSIVTIGLVTLGAFGIQALMKLSKESKSFDQHLEDLDTTLARMKGNMDRVGNTRLSETFGNLAADVRALSSGMLDLDRASELKSLKGAFDTFLSKKIDPSWWQSGGIGISADPESGIMGRLITRTAAAERQRIEQQAGNYAALGAANTFEDFDIRRERIADLAGKGDIQAVTQELLALKQAMVGDGPLTSMSADLQTLLIDLTQLGIKTAEVEAIMNGSAKANAIKRQADQMVLGFRQETEIAAAQAQFGADAIQVEQIRGRHARELLEIRLEDMGVQIGSLDWQRAHIALAERQAQIEMAAQEARKDWLLDQQDRLASITRETSLIGSSNVERLRANALAEAETDIRKNNLTVLEAEDHRKRAIARADAQAAQDQKQAMQDLMVGSVMDIYDDRLAAERVPALRAAIEAEKEYARVFFATRDAAYAAASAEQVRLKVVREAETARRQALAEIAMEGQLDRYDSRISATRNPHTRAAIEAEKEYARVLNDTQDAEQAAASAARVHARALADLRQDQADYIRGQQDSIQQLQLELALVGQTETVRARVLALAQAEREIQRLGLSGQDAELVRRKAAAQVELTRELEAQADAWKRVQTAGETAIDSVLDRLRAGDVKGAFTEMLGEIEQGFFDLAVRNPLKNGLFGSNLGTLGDVGGIAGIWERLSGKSGVDEQALISKAMSPVQSMMVTAANVTIGGAGVASFLSTGMAGIGGAAGGWLAPGSDVQAILASVASGGGARPDAISGLNGQFAGPLAAMIADAQKLFGPNAVQITSGFRSNERQAELWQDALRKYGSPEVARKWVAPPGQSRHNHGVAADLGYGSAQVESWVHKNAGKYGLGFRMGNEPWHIEPQNAAAMMKGQNSGIKLAETALTDFGKTATAATDNLGSLGNGFNSFGMALNGLFKGGEGGGGLGGLLGSMIGGLLGIPAFASGGDHGGGWRIVGENGPELEATGASRIFTAAQTRDILTSGRGPGIGSQGNGFAQVARPAAPQINIHNYSSEPVEQDQSGQPDLEGAISITVGKQISQGKYNKPLGAKFGLTPEVAKR